jgi:rhamnosyltransferase
MRPDVTILIPTFQGYYYLEQCLPFIRLQRYDGNVHVLAADSGSTDGTPSLLKQFGAQVITIPNSDYTPGYARNLLVRAAVTPLVVFITQDIIPLGTDWLDKLVGLLDDPQVGAASVRQVPRINASPVETFMATAHYPAADQRAAAHQEQLLRSASLFSNVCSIVRRELCLQHPFREDLTMGEDVAFANALRHDGCDTLYSAGPAVIHSQRYTLRQVFQLEYDRASSLIDVTDETFKDAAAHGAHYLLDEVAYLARERQWQWIPYAGLYELTRALGHVLGHNAPHLPPKLRKHFRQSKAIAVRSTPPTPSKKPVLSSASR